MSISASTSVGEKGSPPTIDEVESWTRPEKIIEFLRGQNLRLEESDFDVFSNQDVDGTEFLDLSQEDLERWKVPGGRAKKIMRLIKKIKGEGE
ncbi:crinkler family protein, partial [Gigaspora margarita]